MATKFKSKLEADFSKKYNLEYETHKLKYVVTHTYHPDWTVSPTAFIETKGVFGPSDRSKMLKIKLAHPNVKVLLVFQDANKRLSKVSKTTYAQWCNQHDYPWCTSTDHETIKRFIATNNPVKGLLTK